MLKWLKTVVLLIFMETLRIVFQDSMIEKVQFSFEMEVIIKL